MTGCNWRIRNCPRGWHTLCIFQISYLSVVPIPNLTCLEIRLHYPQSLRSYVFQSSELYASSDPPTPPPPPQHLPSLMQRLMSLGQWDVRASEEWSRTRLLMLKQMRLCRVNEYLTENKELQQRLSTLQYQEQTVEAALGPSKPSNRPGPPRQELTAAQRQVHPQPIFFIQATAD